MDAAKTKAQQLIDENAVSTYTFYLHIHLNNYRAAAPRFRTPRSLEELCTDHFTLSLVVFSKSYCPYCQNTKRILESYDAKYKAIELNQESDGDAIQSALAELTGQRTVPNIFINKKHIGGNSDLEKIKGKDLEALLKEACAI
jgi:glutaredoxin 3